MTIIKKEDLVAVTDDRGNVYCLDCPTPDNPMEFYTIDDCEREEIVLQCDNCKQVIYGL